jgi:hypothetical protein
MLVRCEWDVQPHAAQRPGSAQRACHNPERLPMTLERVNSRAGDLSLCLKRGTACSRRPFRWSPRGWRIRAEHLRSASGVHRQDLRDLPDGLARVSAPSRTRFALSPEGSGLLSETLPDGLARLCAPGWTPFALSPGCIALVPKILPMVLRHCTHRDPTPFAPSRRAFALSPEGIDMVSETLPMVSRG